jgi:carbon storage regulator
MFIIARRRGQRITIGDDVEVTVTEISRNIVKLGITAPQTCPIIRSELKDSVEQANREALQTHLSTARGDIESAKVSEVATETRLAGADDFLQPHVKALTAANVNRSTSDNEATKS